MLHAGVMRSEYAHASLKSSGDGAPRESGGLSDDMADDANGQPLTASLMDDALLRASAMPELILQPVSTLTPEKIWRAGCQHTSPR